MCIEWKSKEGGGRGAKQGERTRGEGRIKGVGVRDDRKKRRWKREQVRRTQKEGRMRGKRNSLGKKGERGGGGGEDRRWKWKRRR